MLLILWLAYLSIVYALDAWRYIAVPHMTPIFADLNAILSASDCNKLGYDVFVEDPCDKWGRVHVYSSIWLQLGNLGLTRRDVFWLGLLINSGFIFLSVALVKPLNKLQFMTAAAIFLSPAITLGIERCNMDLVFFGLTALASALFASEGLLPKFIGMFVTIISTALKFYPIALFCVAPFFARNPKRFALVACGSLILTALWFYFYVDELKILLPIVPRPVGPFATGGLLAFKYACPACPNFKIYLATAAAAMIAAFHLARRTNFDTNSPTLPRINIALFLFGLILLLSTFLVNTNYDYRWVFFILMVPSLFAILEQNQANGLAKRLAVLTLAFGLSVLWGEELIFVVPRALEKLLPLSHVQSESIKTCLRLLKQISAWLSLTFGAALAIVILHKITPLRLTGNRSARFAPAFMSRRNL